MCQLNRIYLLRNLNLNNFLYYLLVKSILYFFGVVLIIQSKQNQKKVINTNEAAYGMIQYKY